MRSHHLDTPPSSLSGDDITSPAQDDEIVYMEDVDESDDDDEPSDVSDHSVIVFNKHGGPVFSCDIHPEGEIAVTGAQDDKAFVWCVEDARVVLEICDHRDSVTYVAFSFDGAYLATGDMSGVIKVRKCADKNNTNGWDLVFEYETDDLLWGRWHHKANVLFCGTKSGSIFMFNIPSGETKILPGHNVRVECGQIFNNGTQLAAGYLDGLLKIWDLKKSTVIHQIKTNTDESGICDLDIHPNDKMVASASAIGTATLTTNGKIVGELASVANLETISFCRDPSLGYLALGSLVGTLNIWDVSRQMIRYDCCKLEDLDGVGITKTFWVKDTLLAGCLDGSIRIYDGMSGIRILEMTGHVSEILDMCYNEKKNIILTGSEDHTARIFNYVHNI